MVKIKKTPQFCRNKYFKSFQKLHKICIAHSALYAKQLCITQTSKMRIGTLTNGNRSISNIKLSSRYVSKNIHYISEAHKNSRSFYQSFREIGKTYQMQDGSNVVYETFQIPSILGGKKGEETNIIEFTMVWDQTPEFQVSRR